MTLVLGMWVSMWVGGPHGGGALGGARMGSSSSYWKGEQGAAGGNCGLNPKFRSSDGLAGIAWLSLQQLIVLIASPGMYVTG